MPRNLARARLGGVAVSAPLPTVVETSGGRPYLFAFGAYGWTRLLVIATSEDAALDAAFDWASEHAPGLFCDDAIEEEFASLVAEGCDDDEAWERACVDTLSAGNEGKRMLSWEVSYYRASRDEILNAKRHA